MGRRGRAPESKEDRLWRIGGYIRLSREDGNEVSNSIINQKERILSYLTDFYDRYELVDIYVDDGYTGTDTNRESFQRMLEDIRKQKINCVIVKDLSRLSRNMSDAAYYLENIFVEYDVRFISLELPVLDSYRNPEQMNSILVPIQNVINDDFCRQTSIKVRSVFDAKRKQGKFIGAFAPYGYKKDPEDKHKLIIDEEAASVVRNIFKWYAGEGMSKKGIARRLNELGIPNPAAYKRQSGLRYRNPQIVCNDTLWGARTITEILQNKVYLGHMIQGRYRIKSYKVHTQIATPEEEWFVVENTHLPLIDKELFRKAQELSGKDTRTAPGRKAVYPLSGFVRCPDCGKAMVRSQGGSKTKYSYYQCRTYRDKSKTACTKHSIRAEVLEDIVLQAIRLQIHLAVSLKAITEAVDNILCGQDHCSGVAMILSGRQKELRRMISLKDGLYEDWKAGSFDKEEYFRLRGKYEQQIQGVMRSIEAIKAGQRAMQQEQDSSRSYLRMFSQYGERRELSRSIVVDMVETVYVHGGGEVEIIFAFRDQCRRITDDLEKA